MVEPTTSRRPSVLVIHTDQHRIDCLGAYGNRDIRTPHVDALAADGERFENSFCPYPVCTPSRYSLLSGLYVHEHRGWSNRCTLDPKINTFPRILRGAGYRTAAVGKMHFLPTYLDVGFDRLVLAEQDGPGRWDDDYHRYLMKRNLVDRVDIVDQRREYREHASQEYWDSFGALVSDLPEEHHSTTWIGDRAVEEIEKWGGSKPGLLMAGFIKPHHPFDPPAPWNEMYDPDELTLLPGWIGQCLDRDVAYNRGYFPHTKLSEKALRRCMAHYYATVSQIDHHVGRMIDALKKKGLYENTLIVFTADHGEYLGFHHLLLKGNLMYDALAKVPLIVKWPRGERRERVSDRLVNNVDLAPTICRAVGLEPDPAVKGLDLAKDGPGHEFVFAESGKNRQLMARTKTRKLIQIRGKGRRDDLIFDLEQDPLELKDLSESPPYRKDAETLGAALDGWMKPADFETYVDENAPLAPEADLPSKDGSHRAAIIAYHERMIRGR